MADSYYKDVCRELAALGYSFWKPAKGSHEKWRSEETGQIVLVPFNLKSRHTANAIMKDIGSDRRF